MGNRCDHYNEDLENDFGNLNDDSNFNEHNNPSNETASNLLNDDDTNNENNEKEDDLIIDDSVLNVNPYYKTPTDIAYYFRDAESIKKFLLFFLNECEEFADEIDKNGNQIPYPIISLRESSEQTDYPFFIHVLAKFVAIETNDIGKYGVINRHFGIFPEQFKEKGPKQNRAFLVFILEKMNTIINLGNYKMLQQYSVVFALKLVTHKDKYVEYKAFTFPINASYKIGLDKYIDSEIIAKYRKRWTPKFELEQVAFGKKVKPYLDDNNKIKTNYFHMDLRNLDEFICYKMASNLVQN